MNRCTLSTLPRWLAVLAAAAGALAGCGGGGGAAPPSATANTPPVAEFTSASSVVAGTPLALDASGASDADGDALTYSWSFGNGQRGGGKQIAALFADAGDHVVRLTVGDGRGGVASTERLVTVTAGPAAAGSVAALVVVRDATGALLSGVTVVNVAGGTPGLTGADGRTSVSVDRAVSATLRFSKSGHADQFKAFVLPASAESGYLEVVMTPRMAAATLADAAAGGTIDGSDGARASFEAGSLVDAAGAPVVGAVQVAITPIDVAANARAFPGKFEGTRPSGQQGLIESYGTAEFILTQEGAPVHLAPGRKATIEIPVYTAKNRDGSAVKEGDEFPLWSLNERTGTWIEEGSGRVVAAASPSGLALRGEVTHFSWWNHDQFLFPIAKPKPRCLVDTNADGILEDLTGTGHCWHAGTGPEQPTPFAPFLADAGRKVILAEPRTQRIPTWIAEDFTPATGGKVLLIPADLDITFRSYAKNGTLFGTTVVRLGADVEQDVPMLLEPVQDNAGTLAIALPYDQRFAVASRGEVDRFTFAAEAGASYDLVVSRAASSLLGGTVQVRTGAGASMAGGNFGANAFGATLHPGAAEMVSIEVTAGDASPGSYRIEVRKLAPNAGTCSSPTVLALPSTATPTIPANGAVCFDLSLAADDAIQIESASVTNARGAARLFAPNGDSVALDSFGTGPDGKIRLLFGAAVGGIYRLQITNSEPLAGTVNQLVVARLPLAGTVAVGGSLDYAEAASVSNERFFLVKPQGVSHLAIKLASADGLSVSASVWPQDEVSFIANPTSGRVIRPTPSVLPIVSVGRPTAQGPWQFTLSAPPVDTIAIDTDVALAAPAPGDVRLYRIDGLAGQEWSAGISYGPSSGSDPSMSVYAPLSGQLNMFDQGRVVSLGADGPYTVEVRNSVLGTAGLPLNIRINAVAPPEPIALSASVERSVTLALGEVRRYRFDAVQGQVLALQVASTAMDVVASIGGVGIYDGLVSLASGVTSRHSGARYVQQSGTAVLSLYGTSRQEARATGAVALTLQAPTPTPALLGAASSTDIVPRQLRNVGYVLPADGKHLLCVAYTGATGNGGASLVQGIVWGPSATVTNYGGDLVSGGTGTAMEAIGDLRAGANTLSFLSSLAAPAPLTFRLVPLAPAAPLAIGPAVAGSLVPCERRYHQFAGAADQAYTLRVTAAFAGTVRVYKVSTSGDVTIRTGAAVGGTPLALAPGVERVVTLTIPAAAPYGSGNYIVEIDADGEAAGTYAISLATP